MAHGEYKWPRGKLVVADLEVRDGRLARVTVSGDFFLEPPEALAEISGSLQGAPDDPSEEKMAERVRGALGPEM